MVTILRSERVLLRPPQPSDKPTGCVARRREAYHRQIAEQGTLASRLAHTNHHGMPFASAGRHF